MPTSMQSNGNDEAHSSSLFVAEPSEKIDFFGEEWIIGNLKPSTNTRSMKKREKSRTSSSSASLEGEEAKHTTKIYDLEECPLDNHDDEDSDSSSSLSGVIHTLTSSKSSSTKGLNQEKYPSSPSSNSSSSLSSISPTIKRYYARSKKGRSTTTSKKGTGSDISFHVDSSEESSLESLMKITRGKSPRHKYPQGRSTTTSKKGTGSDMSFHVDSSEESSLESPMQITRRKSPRHKRQTKDKEVSMLEQLPLPKTAGEKEEEEGETLPEGWYVEKVPSKTVDTYWYNKDSSIRLNSKAEVSKFVKCLNETNGDEIEACKILKIIPKKKNGRAITEEEGKHGKKKSKQSPTNEEISPNSMARRKSKLHANLRTSLQLDENAYAVDNSSSPLSIATDCPNYNKALKMSQECDESNTSVGISADIIILDSEEIAPTTAIGNTKRRRGNRITGRSKSSQDLDKEEDSQSTQKINGPKYTDEDNTLPIGWCFELRRFGYGYRRCWTTQETNTKLRSKVEVTLFLECLKESDGDEIEALEVYLVRKEDKRQKEADKRKMREEAQHNYALKKHNEGMKRKSSRIS